MRWMILASILCLLGGCVQAPPTLTVKDAPAEFSTAPGQDAVFDLVVDEAGPVVLRIAIHNGASHGLMLHGPGDCAERPGPWAVVVSGGNGGAFGSHACGPLPTGTHEVRLSGGLVVRGTLHAEGASLVAA